MASGATEDFRVVAFCSTVTILLDFYCADQKIALIGLYNPKE